MKRHRIPLAALIAGFAAFSAGLPASGQEAASGGAQQSRPKTYTVQDARSFFQALGPDRTIVLRKGDYRLGSASGVESEYASWNELDGGARELVLSGLRNLTIRGADGARVVSEEAAGRLLVVSGGSNITLDNIRFIRLVEEDAEEPGGGVYAESVRDLVVDRCSIEGPTGTAIAFWECDGAKVRRLAVRGAIDAAISAMYSNDLEVASSRILESSGYPLVYLEDSDRALISKTRFEGCSGGNFVEIYAESGSVESMVFSDCEFVDNEVEYFAGTDILPLTQECSFEGNSFDEDWPANSVAVNSGNDYDYWADQAEPAYYAHYASGLGFSYPEFWELEESDDQERVGLFAPSGDELVLFVTAYRIPGQIDPSSLAPSTSQAKKVFADSAAALIALVKDEMGVDLSIDPAGDPDAETGLLAAEYAGKATRGEGERAEARVRFVVSGGAVHAFIALAAKSSAFEAGSDIDQILDSAEALGERKDED